MNEKDTQTVLNILIAMMASAVFLVALKHLGLLNWAWIWVVSPVWIPIALFIWSLFFVSYLKLMATSGGFGKDD